jgi:hypothetical protein
MENIRTGIRDKHPESATLPFRIQVSVAIRDVYPGSRILIFTHPRSRIPDPKTANKDRGEKKFVVIPFEIENYLFVKC